MEDTWLLHILVNWQSISGFRLSDIHFSRNNLLLHAVRLPILEVLTLSLHQFFWMKFSSYIILKSEILSLNKKFTFSYGEGIRLSDEVYTFC